MWVFFFFIHDSRAENTYGEAMGRTLRPGGMWVMRGHEYATFSRSPSGDMDDELGLVYMRLHFEPYTRPGTASGTSDPPYCLLIADGHTSHVAYNVEYALDHHIIPFCLPPHSTHLM